MDDLSSSQDEDEIELLLEFDPERWVRVKLRNAKPIDSAVLPTHRSMYKPTGGVATERMLVLLGEIRRRELRRKQLKDPMKVANNEDAIALMKIFLNMAMRKAVGPRYAKCALDIVHPNGEPIIVARGQKLK